MKKWNLWMLSIFMLSIVLTSCKKDENTEPEPTPTINESEILITYLESTSSPLGKDFVNTDMPTIISATEVHSLNLTNQVYIIDIRDAADFTTGHITNAVNVAFSDLWTHIQGVDLTNYTKVAIVCYTGQTAGYGACLLRMLGYDKVFSMKWGMCSWHLDFSSKWFNSISNMYATQFTNVETPKGAAGALPVLSTGKTTGQEIFEARASALFTEGFGPAKVTNATVFGDLASYHIVNYWPATHYADPGHIPGAMQYTPKQSMKLAEDLKTLPTAMPVAVYCYTGQNSAFLSAYLRLVGYDAKSILFGTNGMIYDEMVTDGLTTFDSTAVQGYTYE